MIVQNKLIRLLFLLPFLSCHSLVSAQTFILPENGDSVVGEVSLTTSRHEDTISDIAWAYGQGFLEMRHANPDVDAWLPGDGTEIVIPNFYVLPDTPRSGIVINVPEMRLYYYPKPKRGEPATVITYPISIGRQDWATPYGNTTIISRVKSPGWTPPASIKKEHAENGDPLPDYVPPGPDNPLGDYALGLGKRGYLIHGTNKPYGLGMRVTHGCIRLYPKHIEQLFSKVAVGTRVRIIDQPYKAGWLNGSLYLETHPPLEEQKGDEISSYQQLIATISEASLEDGSDQIDWNAVKAVSDNKSGIPVAIGQINYGQPQPLYSGSPDTLLEQTSDKKTQKQIKEVVEETQETAVLETSSFSELF